MENITKLNGILINMRGGRKRVALLDAFIYRNIQISGKIND